MSRNDLPSNLELGSRGWLARLGVPVGSMVVGVAAWLLTAYAHAPILAAWLAIAAIGWILHRFGRASVLGVVLWTAAAAMLSVGLWTPTSDGNSPIPFISGLCRAGGVLLSLAAGVLFLVASFKDRSRCAGNCAGCMIVFFTVIIPAVSVYTIWDKRAGAEAVQETRQLILTLHRLSAEIEAIRAQMGRLPKDEAELVALRGKPMPTYYRDSRVSYLRDDRNGYRLDCCVSYLWGHGWGWIVCFYGPEAVQRLHAVLF